MHKILMMLIMYLLCAHCSFAQTDTAEQAKGKVLLLRGEVQDSATRKPVPYASVFLHDSIKNFSKAVLTTVDGAFSMEGIPAGNYTLKVMALSYTAYEAHELSISTRSENEKVLVLLAPKLNEIAEVKVEALGSAVSSKIDKINYTVSDNDLMAATTLADILKKVPLLNVTPSGSISMKGKSQVRIYINGIPTAITSSGSEEIIKSIPAISIKRIEVLHNPSAKYDADASGGIINIVTKRVDSGYYGSISAAGGTRLRNNGNIFYSLRKGMLSFSLSSGVNTNRLAGVRESYLKSSNEAGQEYVLTTRRSRVNRGVSSYTFASLGFTPDTLSVLNLSANLFGYDNYSKESGEYVKHEEAPDNEISYFLSSKNGVKPSGYSFGLDYSRMLKRRSGQYSLAFQRATNHAEYTYENDFSGSGWQDSKVDNKAQSHETTFQANYTQPLTSAVKLESGLKSLVRQHDANANSFMRWNGTEDYTRNPEKDSKLDYQQFVTASYLNSIIAHKSYAFQLGIRAEHFITEATFNASDHKVAINHFGLFPNVAVRKELEQSQSLQLQYSRKIQRPGIGYLNPFVNESVPQRVSYGNPGLHPEFLNNLDLTYEKTFSSLYVMSSAYFSFIQNQIQALSFVDKVSGKLITTFFNIGRYRSVGNNVYMSYTPMSTMKISGSLDLSYSKTEGSKGELAFENAGVVYQSNMNYDWELPKNWLFNCSFTYNSPYVTTQGKESSYSFIELGLNKGFANNRFNLGAVAADFLKINGRFKSTSSGQTFYNSKVNQYKSAYFMLKASYNVGGTEYIKRNARTISNNDVKKLDK